MGSESKHKVGDLLLGYKSESEPPILGQIIRVSDFVALGDDRWSYRVLWFDYFQQEEYGAREIQQFYFIRY